MPTASDRARDEAEGWGLLRVWSGRDVPELHDDVPPSERAVVRFFDPSEDLERRTSSWDFDLEGHLRDTEISYIKTALEKAGGNKTEAAKMLGLSFRSFRYRVDKLGLSQDIDKETEQ